MIISIVHSNSHIIKRITNILDYHLHHPYTISNTLIPADLYFTDTLEDIPRIRNINKKAFIVIVTNHPLGPETVIYQPFYYIFEDSLEKDIPFILFTFFHSRDYIISNIITRIFLFLLIILSTYIHMNISLQYIQKKELSSL